MLKFIASRLVQTVGVVWLVATLTFVLVRFAPGSPFDQERNVSPEIKANMEKRYGLDQPVWRQYVNYFVPLVTHGDFGPSFKYSNRTVTEIIGDALPISFEMGFWALLVALTLGVGAGVLASLRRNTALDWLPMSLSLVGISVPIFVVGPLLIVTFSIHLGWFNVNGWNEPADRVLPSLTLGFYYAAYFARLTRGGMLEVLSQDFIRTARAKGASEARVVFRHALRGGVLPVVSFLGPALAGIVTGSFTIETIFHIPGLGRYFIQAALNRDYTLVMGTVILFAALIGLLNLLADVLLAWLNPRVKLD